MYIWTPVDSARVVAYYAIAPTQVRRDEVSRSMSGGVGVIPAYLIARLALDRSLRGQGLGVQPLLDAAERIVLAADGAAGRLMDVDSVDANAAAFDARHDL